MIGFGPRFACDLLGARATLKAGRAAEYGLAEGCLSAGRRAGTVAVNRVWRSKRDGAAIKNEPALRIAVIEDAGIVLVDAA